MLGSLAGALAADRADDVDRLLEEALTGGEFVADPHGQLIARDPVLSEGDALAGRFPGWFGRGCRSLRVKRFDADREAAQAAAAVFRALRDDLYSIVVPHWLSGGMIITLDVPDAVDLRTVAGRSRPDAEKARQACRNSLESFRLADDALRAGMAAAGARSRRFPVAARYADARASLRKLAGPGLLAKLPATVDDATGPLMLFCDPKPANLVLPGSDCRAWRHGGDPIPVAVDLGHVFYESSYVLQAILATFSDPLPDTDEDFAACRTRLLRACARFGVDGADVDRLLIYHLLRNLTTAVMKAQRRKAEIFGAALLRAGQHLELGFDAADRATVLNGVKAGDG